LSRITSLLPTAKEKINVANFPKQEFQLKEAFLHDFSTFSPFRILSVINPFRRFIYQIPEAERLSEKNEPLASKESFEIERNCEILRTIFQSRALPSEPPRKRSTDIVFSD